MHSFTIVSRMLLQITTQYDLPRAMQDIHIMWVSGVLLVIKIPAQTPLMAAGIPFRSFRKVPQAYRPSCRRSSKRSRVEKKLPKYMWYLAPSSGLHSFLMTFDPRCRSVESSFPVYTSRSHMYPFRLSARTHTSRPRFISFIGRYCFIAERPLYLIIASSSVLVRLIIGKEGLTHCIDDWIYFGQPIKSGFSPVDNAVIVGKMEETLDLKEALSGNPLCHRDVMESFI